MDITPIPMAREVPLDAHAAGRIPQLSRTDFPQLNPGDLVGVVHRGSSGPWPWGAFLYVVPGDEEAFSVLQDGTVHERYWGFVDLRVCMTRWGARWALRKLVRDYRRPDRMEVEEFPQ